MHLSWTGPGRRLTFLDALGLVGLLGLAVARFVPVAKLFPYWGCALRRLTGWPCLGCGLTRAADRFSHGDFLGALSANPLGALAAAAFTALAVLAVLRLALGLRAPALVYSTREARWARGFLLVAVALNYAFVVLQTRFPGAL